MRPQHLTTYYCTATQVKAQLRKATYGELGFATEAEFTAAIEEVLADIDIAIDNHCNRQFFLLTGRTETFDGQEQQCLFPEITPIVSLTKVEHRTSQTDSWAEQTLTDFYAYQEYVFYEPRFAFGYQNYRLTFNAGYSAVPTPIRRAAILIAGNAIIQWRLNAQGILVPYQEFKVANPVVTMIGPNEERLLAPYVKPATAIA